MFLKQWLAASDAGMSQIFYHDFSRKQSHHIFPLIRRLKHLTVAQLFDYLMEMAADLRPADMKGFDKKIADISTGKIKIPLVDFQC
jgi:hypothetical protein